MKATKKIVGATAALVAALALSAGSTFAWFSANPDVKATGMQVTIAVPTNLYIKAGYITADDINDITATSITSTTNQKLKPVSLEQNATAENGVDVKIPSGWTSDPTPDDKGTPNGYTTLDTIDCTTEITETVDDYVISELMTVVRKADADAVKTYALDAEVTVSGISADEDSHTYLKVSFIVGDTTNTFKTYASQISPTGTTATLTFSKLVENATDNQPINLAFVVWFDGNNDNCVSNNTINVSTISFEVKFTENTSGT